MQQDDDNGRDPASVALAQLGADPRSVPVAAQIRRLLPDIEAALERGVRQAHIIETLTAQGLKLTRGQFRTELWRARKRARATHAKGSPPPAKTPTPKPAAPGIGASQAERDAYARSVIGDEPSNPRLERLKRKNKGEKT
jgi:hypothetical protein